MTTRFAAPCVAAAAAVAASWFAGTAAHAAWNYDPENTVAWATEMAFHLIADCDKNTMFVAYAMPRDQLAEQLAEREQAYLIVAIDEQAGKPTRYFSTQSKFFDDVDRRRVAFFGNEAVAMAHRFIEAEENIVVGVSVKKPSGQYNKYNTLTFPIEGAEKALRQLLRDCEIEPR